MELNKHIEEDFDLMICMINDLKRELIHYDSITQINFYNPLKSLIFNALFQLTHHNRDNGYEKRIENWEVLHNIIFNTQENN